MWQTCFDTDQVLTLKLVAARVLEIKMLCLLKTEKAMEELRRTRPLPIFNSEFLSEIMCSK